MPNGDSEPTTWSRLHILLAAYHQRYGHWPTHLKLGRKARNEIRNYLGPAHYLRFIERLSPLADDDALECNPILVSDGDGLTLKYGQAESSQDLEQSRLWPGIDPLVGPPHREQDPEGESLH